MIEVTAIAILLTMAMALARAFIGPTVFDRLLAVNTFGTKTVLLIAVVGFLMGRPAFLDIALLYALLNFIGNIAVLKFVKYGDLGVLTAEVLRARRPPGRAMIGLAGDIVGGVLLAAGSAFLLIGGIGLLRMPDLYSRIHPAGITDTAGAGLILLGLMFFAGPTLVAVKLALIFAIIYFTSPTSGHATARAALAAGLRPLLGRDLNRKPDDSKDETSSKP